MAWDLGSGLEGKGVIVTGAAGGMGRPTAQAFASAGARVMAVDLHQSAADEVVAGLEGDGHVAVGMDLTDLDAQKALVDRAVDELGNLYVLAHLAAVLRRRGSMGRVAEPEGIAGVVVFVAGKHAGFVSGATLNVSGALQMY